MPYRLASHFDRLAVVYDNRMYVSYLPLEFEIFYFGPKLRLLIVHASPSGRKQFLRWPAT